MAAKPSQAKGFKKLVGQLTSSVKNAFKSGPENAQCDLCKKEARTATSYCRDCEKSICETCADVHSQWDMFANHKVVQISELRKEQEREAERLKKVKVHCSVHEDMKLNVYCETCEKLICHTCSSDEKHKDHSYDLVDDVFDRHKAEVIASLEPVESRLETANKTIAEIETQSIAVKANVEAVDAQISKEIDGIFTILKGRQAKLRTELNATAERKQKNLARQIAEMERFKTQLVGCLSFARENIEAGDKGEAMKMKKEVTRRIRQVTGPIKRDQQLPCESPDLVFSGSPELVQACKQFGAILTSIISPEKSSATGKGLEVATRGERSSAIVCVRDKNGGVYRNATELSALTCEIVSSKTALKIRGSVLKTIEGYYKVSYQPQGRGKHQLFIKIGDCHIKGSPFPVIVKPPLQELGFLVRTAVEGLNKPYGVAINKQGEIIVAEYGKHCISVFNESGEKIRSFGSQGKDNGKLTNPCGVTTDDDQNILVVDYGNHRIQKFSANGEFMAAVGSWGSGKLQFKFPVGIKFNSKSKRIYVADQSNHRVQILSSSLTFLSTFGSSGIGLGAFNCPCDVAFDSANNVYVTDNGNGRIQVFTERGEYLSKISKKGSRRGELRCPAMMAIDSEDHIFVTEWGSHSVSVFSKEGSFLTTFGSQGKGPQEFQTPRGIMVDDSGMVHICDQANNRIQVF